MSRCGRFLLSAGLCLLLAMAFCGCNDPYELFGSHNPTLTSLRMDTSGKVLSAIYRPDNGWIGVKGWYGSSADPEQRLGIVRFDSSAFNGEDGRTTFTITGFADRAGNSVTAVPTGSDLYFMFYVTELKPRPMGMLTEQSVWTWANGRLQRVQ